MPANQNKMSISSSNEEENKEMASNNRRFEDSNATTDNSDQVAEEFTLGETKPREPDLLSLVNTTEPSNIAPTTGKAIDGKLDEMGTVNLGITPPQGIVEPIQSTAKPQDSIYKSVPAIDEFGMPLPGRSNRGANQAFVIKTPSYKQPQPSQQRGKPPYKQQFISGKAGYSTNKTTNPPKYKDGRYSITPKQGIGCLFRMALMGMLAGLIILIIGGSFIVYEYYKIAATLPSVADLQQRASTFETTRIFDRNGDLLYEILDPTAGRRTFITLDKIAPVMVAATIATEDKSYYSHPGFDWTAIVRAFWQNYQGGGTVSGASTITQQLARSLLLSPEERTEQSYMRKVREALLAAEITRRYTKDQILELYLNEFYYGNLAYGVEAAAETYFNTTAEKLDLAQGSFLAGLPQAPSVYDVYHNRDATRRRQQQVLTLMYEASREQGCIFVSNSVNRVCVDADTAVSAYAELDTYEFNPPEVIIR